MKKLLITTLITLTLACFGTFLGCKKSQITANEFTVNFVLDGELRESLVCNGGTVYEPEINLNPDTILNGWYTTANFSQKWNFEDKLNSDITLYAYTLLKTEAKATVKFTDNGKVLNEYLIEKGTSATEFIPENKPGYSFDCWNIGETQFDFSTLIHDDTTFTAMWELIDYSAEFYADDKLIETCEFNVENKTVDEPTVPSKKYYDGYWEDYELDCEDVVISAVYTPTVYTVDFYINQNIIETKKYTVEDAQFCAPDLPHVLGHKGEWSSYTVDGKHISVYAEYTQINYVVYFLVSGKDENEVYVMRPCTATDPVHIVPEVPQAVGYTSEWENYSLGDNESIYVKPVYTLIDYYVYFYDENELIATRKFNIENFEISPPTVPQKPGYTSRWEEFNLTLGDVDVRAVYTPITYTATFIADGQVIATQNFNIKNMTVTPPLVPAKSGYIGSWEIFELTLQDIEITANYTPVEDRNFTYNLSADGNYYILTGYTGNDKNLTVPQIHDGLPVKAVADEAFMNSNIESIALCDSIENIGESAFYTCKYLTNVKLPETLKVIGKTAFTFCISLNNLIFPASLKTVDENAFESCRFEEITFLGLVESIEPCAFYGCTELKSVTFKTGIVQLKTNAFLECTSLMKIHFGKDLKILYPEAFKNCPMINQVVFENTEKLGIANSLSDYKKDLPSDIFGNPIDNASLFYSMSGYYLIYDYYNTIYDL